MKLFASLVTDARINALPQVNELVEDYCRNDQTQSEREQILLLVCEEVFANIVNHANCKPIEHAIEIKIYHDADHVKFEFKDNGLAFDPMQQQAPQLGLPVAETPVGGLGLTLIQQLSDDLNYHRQGNYNILSLHWHKHGQTGRDQ